MNGYMYRSVDKMMMDGWRESRRNGWVNRWMDKQTERVMDGWVDKERKIWMDRCSMDRNRHKEMDGWMEREI